MSGDFIKVNVNVDGKRQEILMERGTSFSNNGGEYCVFADGTLKFKPTNGNVWQDAKQIEMKKYQWQVFQNVANNDGDVNTYSKDDIYEAMDKYSDGEFTADVQQDLPEGFKISKQKLDSGADLVQADVRMSENVGATLQFRNRGYMRDEVADAKLYASYKPVTVVMPDFYDDEMKEVKGKGTVTTKDGLTTTTIYGDDWRPAVPTASVTKDANGRVVSQYQLEPPCEGTPEYSILKTYTYDDAGRILKEYTYGGDTEDLQGDGTKPEHYHYTDLDYSLSRESIEYTYHDNGIMATKIERNMIDKSATETHYDSQGREVASIYTNVEGEHFKNETIHSENGNVTINYDNGESVTTDSRGNVIERVKANGDAVKMTYDSDNRVIQRIKTVNGSVYTVQKNTYNPDGTLSQVVEDGDGIVLGKAENGQLTFLNAKSYFGGINEYEYKDGVCVSSTLATELKDEIHGISLSLERENLLNLYHRLDSDTVVSGLTSYSAISPDETLEQALSSEAIFMYRKAVKGYDLNAKLMGDLEYRIKELGLYISTEGKTPTQVAKEIAQADSQRLMNEIFK